jgi:hypothetical protein
MPRRSIASASTEQADATTGSRSRAGSITGRLTRSLRFRLALSRIIAGRRSAMQLQQPNNLGEIGSFRGVTRNQPPSPHARMDSSHYLGPVREEALQLLNSGGDRTRYWFAVGALVVGFGLGWTGSSSWYGSSTIVASNPIVQKGTTYRRPEMKSADKIESARTQSTLGTGTNHSPKSRGLSTGALTRPDGQSQRTAAAPFPPDISLPTGSIAVREAILPAPETRPATIEGWTVRDVRGGTVVLEGPDGIRTAVAGDTVPGVGRIDSIVRSGNRWIVATANGLIASP